MITQPWCRRMAQYNRWMNRKLYTCADQLSDEQRLEDRGAFFKSLQGTLDHLVYADTAWMRRFSGRDLSGLDPRQPQRPDFASLRVERERLDAEIMAWVETLDETWLAQTFSFTSQMSGKTFSSPSWQFVTHFFNHQTNCASSL